MRVSFLSLFVVAIISFNTSSLSAQVKGKLYTAKVYTLDNKVFNGTLESATDKGVYLLLARVDTATFVNALQIREIKLRRKGKSSTGATIGFITGLAGGAAAYLALQNNDKLENTVRAVGGVLFTFTATAIGGAIANRPDKIVGVNGRYEDYMQSLQQLKSFSVQGNQ